MNELSSEPTSSPETCLACDPSIYPADAGHLPVLIGSLVVALGLSLWVWSTIRHQPSA